MVIVMGIGKIIAQRRKAINMSQGRLAECVDKSQAHISGIESERDNPSMELLGKIAKALDCKLHIDLIPNESPRSEQQIEGTIKKEIGNESAPTWFAIEQASAATILSIAIEKIKLEKDSMSCAERKTIEGLIETSMEVMHNDR